MNIEDHFKNEANSKSRAFLINDCHNMRWFVLFFALLFTCFICTNCTHSTKKVAENIDNNIKGIDVLANLSNTQKAKLSDIASSIEYCVLELDKKLVTFDMSFYTTDD